MLHLMISMLQLPHKMVFLPSDGACVNSGAKTD